jgi:hypothetical protein
MDGTWSPIIGHDHGQCLSISPAGGRPGHRLPRTPHPHPGPSHPPFPRQLARGARTLGEHGFAVDQEGWGPGTQPGSLQLYQSRIIINSGLPHYRSAAAVPFQRTGPLAKLDFSGQVAGRSFDPSADVRRAAPPPRCRRAKRAEVEAEHALFLQGNSKIFKARHCFQMQSRNLNVTRVLKVTRSDLMQHANCTCKR